MAFDDLEPSAGAPLTTPVSSVLLTCCVLAQQVSRECTVILSELVAGGGSVYRIEGACVSTCCGTLVQYHRIDALSLILTQIPSDIRESIMDDSIHIGNYFARKILSECTKLNVWSSGNARRRDSMRIFRSSFTILSTYLSIDTISY